MPRALLSVSDKTGIVDFARGLVALGFELVSTGGTARTLREGGLVVTDVSQVTGHPEMLDGRVKTLHPAVHASILARRERADDLETLASHGYAPIDIVCVNLYPFHDAAAARAPIPEAMEQVDIGGPSMLRSAAKNHAGVLAVVDPHDYTRVLDVLGRDGADRAFRLGLAAKVFAHTAAYDAAIARYIDLSTASEKNRALLRGSGEAAPESAWPDIMVLAFRHVQSLRYGENPDQPAAFYGEPDAPPGSLPRLAQFHGKELSFNNLLDVDAAVTAASAWHGEGRPVCVIVKHTTPCGVALGATAADAYAHALACDPVSAFGGIVAFSTPVDAATAEALASTFLEIIVAPSFENGALEVLRRRKNLRLLALPVTRAGDDELDMKRVRGGLLVQARLRTSFPETGWQIRTRRAPTDAEMPDLRFAWRVAASVKSNAIVLARDERTVGIGAGQMSRVDAARIAVMKAEDRKADLKGAVLASDAFFPFRDGIDAAAKAGVSAVIQPGGSVRDDEVIAAADEHGMAMIFTQRRVFRH